MWGATDDELADYHESLVREEEKKKRKQFEADNEEGD